MEAQHPRHGFVLPNVDLHHLLGARSHGTFNRPIKHVLRVWVSVYFVQSRARDETKLGRVIWRSDSAYASQSQLCLAYTEFSALHEFARDVRLTISSGSRLNTFDTTAVVSRIVNGGVCVDIRETAGLVVLCQRAPGLCWQLLWVPCGDLHNPRPGQPDCEVRVVLCCMSWVPLKCVVMSRCGLAFLASSGKCMVCCNLMKYFHVSCGVESCSNKWQLSNY